jgi:hypothetical protein
MFPLSAPQRRFDIEIVGCLLWIWSDVVMLFWFDGELDMLSLNKELTEEEVQRSRMVIVIAIPVVMTRP